MACGSKIQHVISQKTTFCTDNEGTATYTVTHFEDSSSHGHGHEVKWSQDQCTPQDCILRPTGQPVPPPLCCCLQECKCFSYKIEPFCLHKLLTQKKVFWDFWYSYEIISLTHTLSPYHTDKYKHPVLSLLWRRLDFQSVFDDGEVCDLGEELRNDELSHSLVANVLIQVLGVSLDHGRVENHPLVPTGTRKPRYSVAHRFGDSLATVWAPHRHALQLQAFRMPLGRQTCHRGHYEPITLRHPEAGIWRTHVGFPHFVQIPPHWLVDVAVKQVGHQLPTPG